MWIRKCSGQMRDPEDKDSKKPMLGTLKQTRKGEELQMLYGTERRALGGGERGRRHFGEVWMGPLF